MTAVEGVGAARRTRLVIAGSCVASTYTPHGMQMPRVHHVRISAQPPRKK